MEPISFSIYVLASVVTALVAGLSKLVVENISNKSMREFVLKQPTGKEKTFEVRPDVSEQQIAETIRQELALEENVKTILDAYLLSIGSKESRIGKYVDFIVELGKEKVAVEVKSNLTRFNAAVLQKYLKEEPDLARLLLLTTQPVSRKIREKSEALEREGKLSFGVISEKQDRETQLRQIADALGVDKSV